MGAEMTTYKTPTEIAGQAISILEMLVEHPHQEAPAEAVAALRNALEVMKASEARPQREPGTEYAAPIPRATLERMRACAPFLPEPGGAASIHLLDHIAWLERNAPSHPAIVAGDACAAVIHGAAPMMRGALERALRPTFNLATGQVDTEELNGMRFGLAIVYGLGLAVTGTAKAKAGL